jgi:hypothetical protein
MTTIDAPRFARRGGFRPGSGRKKGTAGQKHLATRIKELATREQLDAVAQMEGDGPNDLHIMRQVRDFWMGVAGKIQAEAAATVDETGKPAEPDYRQIGYCLDRAAECAKMSAPYRHHKLSKVTIGGNVEHTVDATVRIVISEQEAKW